MADDQDNPGIRVPPLIYLLALLLGLLVFHPAATRLVSMDELGESCV